MQEAYKITMAILERDAYALEALPVHLSAALQLHKKNELFLCAHRRARCHH